MKFVDREDELRALEGEYKRKTSSFVVLYGRRRTGKTTLIKEFGKDKKMLYFLATQEIESQNIINFKNIVADYVQNDILKNSIVNDWNILFQIIADYKTTEKKVIVIDEFQYLCKVNIAFSSIFQRIWDEILKEKNIMVVLCGSLINMMTTEVLDYSSPLYGRRTNQIKLRQIDYKYYKEFFRKKLPERDLIEKYAVTGGVPKYIELFESSDSIFNEIKNNVINLQSFLYEEPFFLLQHEVSEIGSYFSIIKSISRGNTKISDIASNLSVSPTNLSKYIQTLINLDILERQVPITEKNPEKSKKGKYYIKDNYLAFWFKFVYPYRSFIEFGNTNIVMKKIKDNFIDNHVSFVYENVCKQKLWDMNLDEKLKNLYMKIGKYWDSKNEIDLVGINEEEKAIIFGECKYYKEGKLMDVNVLYDLLQKAKSVKWNIDNRKEEYILFSISGYSTQLKEKAKELKNVILV